MVTLLKGIASHFIVVLAFASLAACDNTQRSTFRYKMTVVINDNGRLIRGTSVRDDTFATWDSLDAGSMGGGGTVGDAVVVPVRGRLLVFTLSAWSMIRQSGPITDLERSGHGCTGARNRPDRVVCSKESVFWSPQDAFRKAFAISSAVDYLDAQRSIAAEPSSSEIPLERNNLPVLVTFQGEPALENVHVVDSEHLDFTFGPGVILQSVTVQRSSEPVTRGIKHTLPFLKRMTGGMTCGGSPGPWLKSGPDVQFANPELGGGCPDLRMFTD